MNERRAELIYGQVLQRMDPVRLATPEIWPLIELAIADAVEKGQILP